MVAPSHKWDLFPVIIARQRASCTAAAAPADIQQYFWKRKMKMKLLLPFCLLLSMTMFGQSLTPGAVV
jgi:hypothetical protein